MRVMPRTIIVSRKNRALQVTTARRAQSHTTHCYIHLKTTYSCEAGNLARSRLSAHGTRWKSGPQPKLTTPPEIDYTLVFGASVMYHTHRGDWKTYAISRAGALVYL